MCQWQRGKLGPGWRRCCAPLAIALALGCGAPLGSPEGMLDGYVAATLSAVGEDGAAGQAAPPHPPYPRRRDRRHDVAEQRGQLLESLTLPCGLGQLVAERNSGLGRLMGDSRRLFYEHRFITAAEGCGEGAERGAAGDLPALVATKRAQLPRLVWNTTLGGDEMAAFFAVGGRPLIATTGETTSFADAEEAILVLAEIGREVGRSGSTLAEGELEAQLAVLARHRGLGGALLRSLELTAGRLDAVSTSLDAALAASAGGCPGGPAGGPADELARVFTERYATGVRAYQADLYRAGDHLLSSLDELVVADALPIPAPFESYWRRYLHRRTPDGSWARFEATVEAHAGAWRRLFDACGMEVPGTTGE